MNPILAPVRFTLGRALLALAFIALFHAFCCTNRAEAQTPVFRFDNATPSARIVDVYNDADITTTVHVLNATDAPLPLPRPCEMTTCAHPQLAPHSVAMYSTSGRGSLVADFDPALFVYSDFASKFGRLRQDPCVAVDELWLHDLIPSGVHGFNSGIYVAPVDRDTVVSIDGGPQIAIAAGDARILPNGSSVAHLVVQTGAGKVCAFGYGNQQDTGSLFAVTH